MSEQAPLDIRIEENQTRVKEQLNRILSSKAFDQSPKMKELLTFVVEQTLAGNGDRLKQFTIATEVFDRDAEFDHQADPIVRIQAGRVRRTLETYYLTEGVNDPLFLAIPKGRYSPVFTPQTPQAVRQTATLAQMARDNQRTLSPTITVLPFLSLSDDAEKRFFAEGFGEELATELARFDMLKVVSMHALGDTSIDPRTSADVKGLGEELGVSFITSGTMQTLGNKIRIYAKLYRTDSGEQVWAEKYTCDLTTDDLFAVQDEIIAEVVAELASSFGIIHREIYQSCNQKKIEHLSTYEATLRYRHYLMTLSEDTHQQATQALLSAVEREPYIALLHAMLAVLYFDAEMLGMGKVENAVETGLSYAKRAVELEPTNQESQIAMLMAHQVKEDINGIIETVDKVLAINPNAAYQIGLCGWALCMAGEFERGLRLIADSKALNPFRPPWFSIATVIHQIMQDNYDDAEKSVSKLSLRRLFWVPMLKAIIHVQKGEFKQAQASYKEMLQLRPDFEDNEARYLGAFIASPEIKNKLLTSLARL
ncbi:transmembrane adenylate cyclase [Vibrio nomapromontoriensis]|uniref:transmembrane adenylate cyclase n=1 Tax=Vibrio nomapromontoriensis TaxID=2910246 RepID=UPI003D14C637